MTTGTQRGVTREAVQLMIQEAQRGLDAKFVEVLSEQRAQGQQIARVLEDLRTVAEALKGGQHSEGLEKVVMRQAASVVSLEAQVSRLTREVFGEGNPGIHEMLREHGRKWSLMSRLSWLAITTIAGVVASIAARVF